MKNNISKVIVSGLVSVFLISCGNNTSGAPSIKDNSAHKQEAVATDYSGVASEKLLKQVQAHYDLEEYQVAQDKLSFLMQDYPDSLNGVDLNAVKHKIDIELSKEQKKIQQIAKLEQNKRLSGALEKMKVEKDGKYTVYKDKATPEFETKECFYIYIKKDVYGAKLFFKIRYIDAYWLNIENYIINVDKLDYTITGEVQKTETKGKKKYTVELLDKEITSAKEITMLNAIANGTTVSALYVGKDSYKKRDISEAQKASIQNTLDAYAFFNEKKKVNKINVTSTDSLK